MQSKFFEAFRSLDIAKAKALKAAGALSKRDDDVAALKSDVLLIMWMLGFVLAFQVAFAMNIFGL